MVGAMMSHFSISKLSPGDLHITDLDFEQEVQMVLNTRRSRLNVTDLLLTGTAGSTETCWGIAYAALLLF